MEGGGAETRAAEGVCDEAAECDGACNSPLSLTQWHAWLEEGSNAVQGQFYKQFTRPMAKVLLLAVFTYQLAYWGWAKLETDEIRAERDGESWQENGREWRRTLADESLAEIATLEAKVHDYEKAKTGDQAAKSS